MFRRNVAVLLLLAVFVTACASGSSGESVSTSDTSTSSDSGSSPDSSTSDDSDTSQDSQVSSDDGPTMAASSPLGAFFADDGGFDAAIQEYTTRVEESIVKCMAAQGFDFEVTNGNFGDNPVEERQNEMTAREWTSEFGFGISTSFDSVLQTQTSDPNTAIFLSMSESEREIWIETLTGGGFEAAQGDFNSSPLEEQGCVGAALIETGGQEAIEGLDGFGDVYDEGEEALFDRREMIEVIDKWARCMSEAGFPNYAKLDDPEEAIGVRLDQVTAPLSAALDEITPEEGQALFSGDSFDIESLPDLDVEALRELQADEIALAIADLDCYEAEVQTTYEPLRDEFENGLLDEYADEFDALRNIGS